VAFLAQAIDQGAVPLEAADAKCLHLSIRADLL
jgi:hypothetical protein